MPEKVGVSFIEASGAFPQGVKVDMEKGVIYGVRVLNRISENGREYSKEALDDVTRLTEGVRVFDQHSKSKPGQRSVSDQMGILRNGRRVPGGVEADFFVSARAAWVLKDAQRIPESLCLSTNSEGCWAPRRRSNPRKIVGRVNTLNSVDLVPVGGTTATLFENQDVEGDIMPKLVEVDLVELRNTRPDLVEQLTAQITESLEADSETQRELLESKNEMVALKESLTQAKAKIDTMETAQNVVVRKELVATKLQESKLPDDLISDTFTALLESMSDDAAIDTAIADRVSVWESGRPTTGGPRKGASGGEIAPDVKDFVKNLRS